MRGFILNEIRFDFPESGFCWHRCLGTFSWVTPENIGQFENTHWSLLLSVADDGRQRAMEYLFRTYAQPLRVYSLRFGVSEGEVDDAIQEFLLQIFEGQLLQRADPEVGRFRSYLLGALRHFLADRRDRARRLKRGGGVANVPLDEVETHLTMPEADTRFDEEWAWALFNRAIHRMEGELEAKAETANGPEIRDLIFREQDDSYDDLARRLRITLPALKSRIFRLRKRFREIIQSEVRRTVPDEAACEEELRYLCSVLGARWQ